MRPITTRSFAPILSAFGLLGLWLGSLVLGGCDASESENLLNPSLPDSGLVRVVNLVSGTPVSVTLSTTPAATNLGSFQISPFSSFFSQETFPIYVSGSGQIDTLADQRIALGVNTTIHTTYLVTGNSTARRVISLITSSSERKDLEGAGIGRVYFINATTEETLMLKRGCRAGDTLYRPIAGSTSGGIQDLTAGEYALYLFRADGTSELTSAHLRVNPGEVTFLIAADNGSGPKLYQLNAAGSDIGGLMQAEVETRTQADVEVLNAIEGTTITASIIGLPNPLAQDVQSRELSPSVSIEACTDSNGDTLQIVAGTGETTDLPIRVGVGTRTLAAIYATNAGTRILTLDRTTLASQGEKVYLRGVNLSRLAPNVSVVIGAGAPAGVAADLRPFGALKIGEKSNYVPLPAGLYPFSLQLTLNGAFLDGGLENLAPGYYTILIMEENGKPAMYILRDDVAGSSPQRLDAPGRTVLFFNMAPDASPRFEASTSIGTLAVESVPYSYVFPTILPAEQITITASGIGQKSVDFSGSGYTIGATGTAGNYQLIAFPLPPTQSDITKAGIRFLNAVPGSAPLNMRINSQGDPIATDMVFGVPSAGFQLEPRRYSFAATLASNNDTVTLSQGVQLSGGRNYLLVIGPKGPTSASSHPYGTLWIQE